MVRTLWALLLTLAGPALAQESAPLVIEEAAPNGLPEAPRLTQPLAAVAGPDTAVNSPILTVDQDMLFARSAWGRRVQQSFEAEQRRIAAENERLVNLLSEEEAELTRLRSELDPAEFRRRADAFDDRATEVRRERAQVVQDLNARAEADSSAFLTAALPVMGELMANRGAVVVLERRAVFVSLDAIDVTEELIAKLDATIGDGGDLPTALVAPTEDEAD